MRRENIYTNKLDKNLLLNGTLSQFCEGKN